jgi:hypothetical protein
MELVVGVEGEVEAVMSASTPTAPAAEVAAPEA